MEGSVKHEIKMKLPPAEVINRDVTFVIMGDGAKLGELRVSRGSIDWRPRGQQKFYSRRWRKFAELMEG